MNFRLVFKLTGKTLLVEAGALLLPLLVCMFYRENPLPFLLSIAMTGAVGLALSLIRSNDHFFPREGFFAVALIWLLMSAFGALPFFFSGFFPSYVDCFFESVSGFTTTGASILTAVEPLPRGILFWRSFMHWMGGMGVLILTIALLPSLGGRTLHVMPRAHCEQAGTQDQPVLQNPLRHLLRPHSAGGLLPANRRHAVV